MLVVAFYTKNTPYEQEVQNVAYTCTAHGLKYHLQGYDSRGHWTANCGIKPEFILDMLTKFQDNLLYVDADAEFKKYPQHIFALENSDTDIAAYIMKGGTLLSGTIFFRNNEKVKALVNEWIKMQRMSPDKWDQQTLHETIVNHGPRLDINFSELPSEYCRIQDKKDWGDPVILHKQKSREYKNTVKDSIMKGVPAQICKQRITVHGDGSFTIPRRNREAEAYLDKHYRRVPGERRWFKMVHQPRLIETLRPIFVGKKCYIIGKGTSLDRLTADAFDDASAPVIAINESIHIVEKLGIKNPCFALQQDMGLRDTCLPKQGAIIVSSHAQHWYAEELNKYVYDPIELDLASTQLSVICAIAMAKKLGTTAFDLICFDACVNGNINYAKCVGYEPTMGGDPKRFLKHRKHIEKHIEGYKTNWIVPSK